MGLGAVRGFAFDRTPLAPQTDTMAWVLSVALVLLAPNPAVSEPPGATPPRRILRPTLSEAVFPRSVRPAAADAMARDLDLVPAGDGYRYQGVGGERFDARIHSDGHVEFDIDPSVQVNLEAVCLIAVCVQSTKPSRQPQAAPKKSLV